MPHVCYEGCQTNASSLIIRYRPRVLDVLVHSTEIEPSAAPHRAASSLLRGCFRFLGKVAVVKVALA